MTLQIKNCELSAQLCSFNTEIILLRELFFFFDSNSLITE